MAIQSIFNDVVLNTTATFEENPQTLEQIQKAFDERTSLGLPTLVAEFQGKVVGYGALFPFRKASGYKCTLENSVHVSPEFRGHGIGTQILKKLIQWAEENKYRSIIAALDASNIHSLHIHEKLGFQQVAKIPRVAVKFSRVLDLTLLQRICLEETVS